MMQIVQVLKEKQDFSYTEAIIADGILKKGMDFEKSSARKIAKEIHVAPSTLVRFFQKLGFQGFNDFKEAYLKELNYTHSHFTHIYANYPFAPQDKNVVIAHKIGQLYHECIDDVLNLLSHDDLQKALRLLNNAKTICLVSSGVQSEIAQTFKDKMLKIGKCVIVETKMDQAFYHACYCDQTWAFVMISYSGETEVTLRVAKKIKAKNIPMLALCAYGKSPLSTMADVVLNVSTREKLVENLGNFGMNISTLLILDILYANLFNQNPNQNLLDKIEASHEFELYRRSENEVLKDR